jgi:hypothetical protein
MPVSKPAGIVPVGGVIAWLKSLTNTPTLPSEWLECNGQALTGGSADAQSVYNGGTIPNLNGASSGTKRFLRGSATSGGSADNESHSHSVDGSSAVSPDTIISVTPDICLATPVDVWQANYCCSGGTGSFSVNTGSASSLPSYYEVVWILRIK